MFPLFFLETYCMYYNVCFYHLEVRVQPECFDLNATECNFLGRYIYPSVSWECFYELISALKYFAVEVLLMWIHILPRGVTRLRWNSQILRIFCKPGEYKQQIIRSVHNIRYNCIKSKYHERNITRRPRVLGVQSDATESKVLYTCVKVPI